MLPKEHRLRKKKDIDAVHKKGRFSRHQFLSLKCAPNQQSASRFTFLVGTKISKKAVERNRVKRQLREITRGLLPNIVNGFDVLVFVRQDIIGKKYEDLAQTLTILLKQAGLFSTKRPN
ncbi:ribonuclease P protein component [Patescibacteria group bacterium]|nr:ribonuclease P protein component [Patescibacteria group bacterium]